MSWKTITPNLASTRSEKIQLISRYFNSLEARSQILSKKLNYILSKVGDSDWLSKMTYSLDNTDHTLSLTGYTGSSRPDIPTFATVNSTYYDVNKSNVKIVTISSNGGSELPKTTFECISGCTLGSIFTGLGSPTKHDYVFDGWYTAASGGSAVSATTVVSSNTTIYAHWKYMPQTFSLTKLPSVSFSYDPGGGTSVWGGGEVSNVSVIPPEIGTNAPVDITVTMYYRIVTTKGTSNNSATFKCNAGSRNFTQIAGEHVGTLYQTHVTSTPIDSVTGSASGYTYSGGTFTRN